MPVYTYPAEVVNLTKPVILPTRTKRRGAGWGQTVLIPKGFNRGAVVQSEGLEKWKGSDGKGRWTYEGVPVGLALEDVAIDGQCEVNPQPHLYEAGRKHTLHGADIYSPGACVRRVAFHDLAGWGLILNYGSSTLKGWQQVTDTEQPRIQSIRTQRTLGGVWIQGGADGEIEGLELYTGGGTGGRFDGAAWIITTIHAAGWLDDATEDNPDAGVGILNSFYENHFLGVTQADHCRVGMRSRGPFTTVQQFVGKRCTEIALDAQATIEVGSLNIKDMGTTREFAHFNDSPIGVVLGPEAQFSRIDHGTISAGQATHATAMICEASRCTINVENFWGCGAQGNMGLVYGSREHAPCGGTIVFHGNGCGTVLVLQNIGAGNDILILHGDSASPVHFPVGVRDKLAKGNNRLISRNLDSGEVVCWNDFKIRMAA